MRVIYGLIDPADPPVLASVRYVGQTTNPETRVGRHVCQARSSNQTYRSRWIRSLLTRGVRPEMIVLEVVPPLVSLDAVEVRWIDRLRVTNRLTNGTRGGGGGSTRTGAPWNKGLKLGPYSAEHRAAIAAGAMGKHVGRAVSAETRAKQSAARRGRPHSPEHVANQAASLRRTFAARRAAAT